MADLWQKMNLKTETEIVVVDAPESFEVELARLSGVEVVRNPAQAKAIRFALAFVTRQSDLDRWAKVLTAKAEGDALLWFAYPKQSSKRYRCEFNRDSGWDVLGAAGFETVRSVAIDEDWTGLRFRRAEFIKSMSREAKRAISDPGKKRVTASARAVETA